MTVVSRLSGVQHVPRRSFLSTVVFFGLALLPLPGLRCWGQLPDTNRRTPQDGGRAPATDAASEIMGQIEARVKAAVARAEKSVVAISRLRRTEAAAGFQLPNLGRLGLRPDEAAPTDADFVPSDYCAGVVIERSVAQPALVSGAVPGLQGGLIVTSYHSLGDVLESDYYVWSRNRPARAHVLAADPWFDLAILRVEGIEVEPIILGDARQMEKGQFVVALGNPQAIARDGMASAAWGLVANRLRRAPRVPEQSQDSGGRESVHQYGTLLQIDAPLDPGFAGGAVINLSGEMIGLMTAYAGTAAHSRMAGFAIPVDAYFRKALEPLKVGRSAEFGFLGVGPSPLDVRWRQQGRHGALVESVLPGTPAARAGLAPGDVITHANGEPLFDDDDLIRVIGSLPPDTAVPLQVFRGDLGRGQGEERIREAVLTKRPSNSRRPPIASVPPPAWRGMRVDYASVALQLGAPLAQLPPEGCLVVVDVVQDSPAWQAGVRPRLYVLTAAAERVTKPSEFFRVVEGQAGDVPLQVTRGDGVVAVQTVSP